LACTVARNFLCRVMSREPISAFCPFHDLSRHTPGFAWLWWRICASPLFIFTSKTQRRGKINRPFRHWVKHGGRLKVTNANPYIMLTDLVLFFKQKIAGTHDEGVRFQSRPRQPSKAPNGTEELISLIAELAEPVASGAAAPPAIAQISARLPSARARLDPTR
jgi:hypothetical protein